MKRCLTAVALISALLQSCSFTAEMGEKLNTIDFVVVPYHDPLESYNSKTASIDSCEHRDCGSPITVFYSDGTVQDIPTVGGRGKKLAISPNRQYLAISDAYGIHVAHDHQLDIHPKTELTDSVRGITISNDGDFTSIEHIGSREINGKTGFASLITWSYSNKIRSKIEIIDGNFISCNNNGRLYSYGDEDDNSVHVYTFNRESGLFKDIGNIYKANTFTPISHFCTDDGSLISYGTIDNFLNYSILNDLDLVFRSGDIDYDEAPTISHQSLSIHNNIAYYATYHGNIHTFNFENNRSAQSFNYLNLLPTTPSIDNTAISLQDNIAFILSKSASNNRWIASQIDMSSGKLINSNENELLNRYYPHDTIEHLYVINKEGFADWITQSE